MKRTLKIILLLTLLVAAAGAALWLKRELAIDSCLDQGGAWNDNPAVCRMPAAKTLLEK